MSEEEEPKEEVLKLRFDPSLHPDKAKEACRNLGGIYDPSGSVCRVVKVENKENPNEPILRRLTPEPGEED